MIQNVCSCVLLQSLFGMNSDRSVLYLAQAWAELWHWQDKVSTSSCQTKLKASLKRQNQNTLCVSCDKWSINVCQLCLALVHYQYVYFSVAALENWGMTIPWIRSFTQILFILLSQTSKTHFHCEVSRPSLNDQSYMTSNGVSFFFLPLSQQ